MKPWLQRIQNLKIEPNRRSDGLRMQQFILDIAGRLPNLHFLNITGLDWTTSPPHPTTYRTFTSLHALEELVLYRVTFPAFGALRRILVSLPKLRSVQLQDLRWPLTRTEYMLMSTPRHMWGPAVVDLSVHDRDGWSAELFRWLALTQTKHSMRRFNLDCGDRAWPQSCIDFVTVTARLVTELYYPHLTADLRRLPIPTMVSLRVLNIDMDRRDPWMNLAIALEELPGTHLQKLRLANVRVAYPYSITSEPTFLDYSFVRTYDGVWELDGPYLPDRPYFHIHGNGLGLIELILSEERFKQLEFIDFWSFKDNNAHGRENHPVVAFELHRRMPKLSWSGVLRVKDKPTKDYQIVRNAIADNSRDLDSPQESDTAELSDEKEQSSSSSSQTD
ncbi:hypothetical protein C8Q80DRAFT_899928 [Daedaleopsis nitida]|nr:hypothetical protein C8Q80DRAFT_899928 [Daedaleopsis nitida]